MKPELKEIYSKVCESLEVNIEAAQKKNRKRELVLARQIAYYHAKEMTDYSLSVIGKDIGSKDHATVLYGIRTIKDLMSVDKKLEQKVNEIAGKINFNRIGMRFLVNYPDTNNINGKVITDKELYELFNLEKYNRDNIMITTIVDGEPIPGWFMLADLTDKDSINVKLSIDNQNK